MAANGWRRQFDDPIPVPGGPVEIGLNSGRIKLVDNRHLVSQFCSLERRTHPSGRDRIDHGPGGSDDVCNAAAGALVRAIHEPAQRSRRVFIDYMGR